MQSELVGLCFMQCRRSCSINTFGQNWLDLGKYGCIWAKLKRNLDNIEAKFGQK